MVQYCSPQHSKSFFDNISSICLDFERVKKGKSLSYYNIPSVFDIEASSFYENDQKRCVMYAWVFGIGGRCIRGRTWEEFKDVYYYLVNRYNTSLKNRLIIYIHNLSYEFQWFNQYFKWYKVFSMDNRKPLYAITEDGIEFRCSYLLSGYSLSKLGENLTKYKVQKRVGDLDYNLIRHSKTPLNSNEWGYILNDGLVVMAHIQEEMERLGNITKIPLTKTGYVRNLCRERCLKGANRWHHNSIIKMSVLDPMTYYQLKRAFTGGFTHANIHYVDRIISDVDSFDFTSSYPAVMVSEKYPMGTPFIPDIKNEEDFKNCLAVYCCMFDCKFNNLIAKQTYESYISISRCIEKVNPILNNGRVLEADSVTITLTEQDFYIIQELYEWDSIEVSNMCCYFKDYLPKDLVLTILELYKDKTELKGVVGKEVEYLVSKGMINSCYGMCVTDPCRNEFLYENNTWSERDADVVKLLDKYNKSSSRFLYYPWGVWVTAYARRNLFKGITEFKEDYIYSDTDSIKVINTEKHQHFIDKYNQYIVYKIEQCLNTYDIPLEMMRPKTIKGVEKVLGVWEYEGRYTRFKTLGAKRYMVEKNGEIEITVAGVSKTAGVRYLKHMCKDNTSIFNAFVDDMYFPANYDRDGIADCASGKMCHTYIDYPMQGEVIDYLGNKAEYYELSGVHLENTDYSLGIEESFMRLILGYKESCMV